MFRSEIPPKKGILLKPASFLKTAQIRWFNRQPEKTGNRFVEPERVKVLLRFEPLLLLELSVIGTLLGQSTIKWLGMTICTEPMGTRSEPLFFRQTISDFFPMGYMVEAKG